MGAHWGAGSVWRMRGIGPAGAESLLSEQPDLKPTALPSVATGEIGPPPDP